MTAPARSAARTAAPRVLPAARPFLRLVPQARATAAGRAPFAAVVVALLAAGLLGLLALNTVLAEGAFSLHALQQQSRGLALREQVLQRQVEALRAPASLAQRAGALGMVEGGPPAHLRLSDGAVLGTPVAGLAPVVPAAPAARGAQATGQPTGQPAPGSAQGSTTWTAPRRSPAPRASGTTR